MLPELEAEEEEKEEEEEERARGEEATPTQMRRRTSWQAPTTWRPCGGCSAWRSDSGSWRVPCSMLRRAP